MSRLFLLSSVALVAASALTGCARARIDPQFSPEPRLEATIQALGAKLEALRVARDSVGAQNDSLRVSASLLEADLRDREEQMRALRLELQRLKEIDLKPRPRRSPP
ncbi:MAG: hypothetical protein WD825_07230 [Gemmatimonadaceae bacterium]